MASLRSLESGVWSHSGVWSLESGVTPESGVWSVESLRSLLAEVWSHSGVWSLESGGWNLERLQTLDSGVTPDFSHQTPE